MKRKIFSKLLMVAMLIASVSSFVSCKDYDDDINNLQDQINKAALQSELAALQQTVANNATAAKAAADAAEAAAKKYADELAAKSTAKADDLEKLIAQVKAVADAAATKDDLGKVEEIAKAAATQAALTEAIAELNGAIEKVKAVADAAATKEELAKAQEELKAAIKKVEDAAAEAKTLAQKAQETADKANTDLAAEVTRAKEAEEKLDAAIKKALEDANKYTDDALTASKKYTDDEVAKAAATAADELAKAIAKVYTKTEVDALIADAKTDAATKLANALGDLGTATVKDYVNTQIGSEVADLKEELADTYLTKADFEKITGVSGSLTASVDALYKAVTSVELIGSYTAAGANGGLAANNIGADWTTNDPVDLTILHGIIGETSKFGDNEAISKGTVWATATNPMDFAANDNIEFESGIIVRVSPSNADLTKSNAKILLVNSLGEGLDDYVVAGTPVRYDGLITRGTNINSGLWVIPFKVVEGVDEDAFADATWTHNPTTGALVDPILYAVAINNTSDDADRYAISSYDVQPDYETYEPAFTFGFKVDNQNLEAINNRWYNAPVASAMNIHAEEADKTDAGLNELLWRAPRIPTDAVPNPANGALYTPATAIVGDYTKTSAADNTANAQFANAANQDVDGTAIADVEIIDARAGKNLYAVEVGKAFTIKSLVGYRFEDAITREDALTTANYYYTAAGAYVTNTAANKRQTQIKAYYVVLDEPRAIESDPSEVNAWKSYDITGLNTVTPADQSLDIVVNSASANGDVIGFRVFAVNYDGTLADPDGRAFYVQVGDPANIVTVPEENAAAYIATSEAYAFVANDINAKENKYEALVPVDGSKFQNKAITINNGVTTAAINLTADESIIKAATNVHYTLLKSDKKTAAANWQEIAYVGFSVDAPGNWVNNGIKTITIEQKDAATGRLQNRLNVKIQKKMPTQGSSTFTWRTTLEPVGGDAANNYMNGTLVVYPMPSNATVTTTAAGVQTIKAANYPASVNPENAGYKWPDYNQVNSTGTTAAAPYKTTYALVDLGGYANMVGKAAVFDWVVEKAVKRSSANDTDIKIDGKDGANYTHFMMATDPANVNSSSEFVSHIDATYVGISLTAVSATPGNWTVPNFWQGKVKFASLFNPDNNIIKYSNSSYRWNLNDATDGDADSKKALVGNDYYWFYGEGAKLAGKFDTNTAAGKKATYTSRKTYEDLLATTVDQTYFVGTAQWASYALDNLFSLGFVGANADATQTNYLKAKNAGLNITNQATTTAALPNYISYGNTVTLSDAAARVMTVTSDGTNLTFAALAGKDVVQKHADQTATVSGIDQFGVAIPNMSFKFTIVPETMAIENAK